MRSIETEILIIGGGATGTGAARDAALRGFKTVLIERSDLATGTTGRYHGLLHSGGRYAVRDPLAARECIEENRILRRILPHCIEDTGGFFVSTPGDDPEYPEKFIQGCRQAGIPVEEVALAQMLKEEPLLNPGIWRCLRVPDASADSWLAAESNAESARQHGAQVLHYHEARHLLVQDGRVCGAQVRDVSSDEEIQITADLVINAAGAWAGKVAASAGIPIKVIPGKGVMLAVNQRILNTVVNRLKYPGDGDIFVPAHTVTVIGTTDVPVEDPDHYAIENWEVELMMAEGEKLVPGLSQMRILRAWAGVRPLYKESGTGAAENRAVSRAFALLDHAARDGVPGLITITGGKWTTYRKMAEVALDLACAQLGVQRECRTHLEILPGAAHGYHSLGGRLQRVEQEQAYGRLICECELARVEDIQASILQGSARTLDDIRRDARLGMGPCQGGFCTVRAAGLLHTLRSLPVEDTNAALRDFLKERWKGLLPVLWGQQLRQERLDELIYLGVLNTQGLPGPSETRLAPSLYTEAQKPAAPAPEKAVDTAEFPAALSSAGSPVDVLVVGEGLAGLGAAWQSARQGLKTRLISKGFSSLYWSSGCIDVLGYLPGSDEPLIDLEAGLQRLVMDNPQHPYARVGVETIREALAALQGLAARAGYPLEGALERNALLPTALGTLRPTCLYPASMSAGRADLPGEMLLVGFQPYLDFFPALAAANLRQQGLAARDALLDLPSLRQENFVTARVLATRFGEAAFRQEVVEAVRPNLKGAARVGFPAVLGFEQAPAIQRELEKALGVQVFEIPCLPPSIPGIRLARLLRVEIERLGGQVYEGMQVVEARVEGSRVTALLSEAAARLRPHRAGSFVLCTGGILGGGIRTSPEGRVEEAILGLPVSAPAGREAWLERAFVSPKGHPIFHAGLITGADFRPCSSEGKVLYENLYCAGSALAGADTLRERSLEGAAWVTGVQAARSLAQSKAEVPQ